MKNDEANGYTTAEEAKKLVLSAKDTNKLFQDGYMNGSALANDHLISGHLENGIGLPLLKSELYETKKVCFSHHRLM